MRRLSFLPIFFTALSIAFVIALAIRLPRDARELATRSASLPRDVAAVTKRNEPPPEPLTPPERPTTTHKQEAPEIVAAAPEQTKRAPRPIKPPEQTPPQPPQSAIARVLAPLAKFIGAAPAPPKTVSASTPVSAQTQHQSASTRPEREAPKDLNSDSTPPQLLSAEFVPPQVHDGEETTIVITAVDDLSGIRGISGTISSPTGKAPIGFSEQRESPESNRYVGRVLIPKNAEAGLWHINFINLSDNASNSIMLSFAQGTVPQNAVLRVVSSQSDSSPPTLKNIWVDRRAIRGGERDTIFIEAIDDNSGVSLVSAVLQSPSKLARIGASCGRGERDVWRCEFIAPACIDCGDWQLEQVTLQDKANNLAIIRQDNPIVQGIKINIAGDSCDNTPPVLQSLVLSTNEVALGRDPGVITVTVVATDDTCGIAGVSAQYVGPGAGSGGFFALQQAGDSNTFTGRILLDPRAARGLWRINSVQLTDRAHNLRLYYASDPLLQNGIFHVR